MHVNLKVETSSPDFWTRFTCEEANLITKSTLLLTGDKSLKWLQMIIDELNHCLPNSEFEKVPDTTHEVTSDNPKAYNDLILNFLSKQST